MSLSQSQLAVIKKRLKDDGLNDGQIEAGLSQIMGEYETRQQSQPVSTDASFQQGQAPAQATLQGKQQDGIVSSFFKSLYSTAIGGVKLAAGVGYEAARAVDYAAGNKEAYDVYAGGKGKQNPFLSKEEIQKDYATPEDIAINTTKEVAGTGSFFVPGGAGVAGAVKAGAVSGALFGLSEGEGVDVENIIYSAAGGAAGGAVLPLAGKAAGLTKKGVQATTGAGRKVAGITEEAAAQSINKATPSMWDKALTEHGFDLNSLTAKYWKKGAAYDDMLGGIGERGKGGVFGQKLNEAEGAISEVMGNSSSNTLIPMDDFVKNLQAEKKILAKIPGNESNITALDEFIKGFQTKYADGMTPKQLLEIKRATDSRFGAAVAEETTGTPTAQAQKMLANAARGKLKSLFPTVADALDTQSEVLTMRPIINRARAISKTRGSEIRSGKISNIQLLNPLSWSKASEIFLDDPKRASLVLKSTEEVIEGAAKPVTGSRAGQVVGGAAGASITNPQGDMNGTPQQQLPQGVQGQYPENQANQNDPSMGGSIAQDPATLPFGGRSKKELMQLALAEGATLKDLKEVSDIYDMIAGDEEETQQLELTDSAIKSVNDLQAGLRDIQSLSSNIASTDIVGPIKGHLAKIPYATEARTMQAEIDRVRQTVGKAIEGGVLRKEDEDKYKKILPVITDTKEVAISKLQTLEVMLDQDLQNYVSLQRSYGKGRGFENITGIQQ